MLPLAWFATIQKAHAAAALIKNIGGCDFTNGLKGASNAGIASTCVAVFIGHLIQWVLGFVGAFCLINIMIGGYQIALGSAIGDKEAGKGRVLWALIGLFVSLISYGLMNLLLTTISRP